MTTDEYKTTTRNLRTFNTDFQGNQINKNAFQHV